MSYKEKKWFKWLVVSILVLLLLYLLNLNRHLFAPIGSMLNAVFVPFIVTGVLYYMLRPLVVWLERQKVPRGIAVLILFVSSGFLLFAVVKIAGPFISRQFASFARQVPEMVDFVTAGMESLRNGHDALSPQVRDALPDLSESIRSEWERYAGSIADSLMKAFSWISNMLFVLSLVPFILYYMLKDGERLVPHMIAMAPASYRKHLPGLLQELDETLASFIRGKAIVSLAVGILLLIGYSIIGLEYALVLACIGMFANIVPFFGPIIGAVPAMLVALFQDPVNALYIVLVTVIIQQIEGNFISPQVMGRTMDIHPLTVIVLILAAGSVTGLVGVLLVVPVYAVAKVLLEHGVKLYHANNEHMKQ